MSIVSSPPAPLPALSPAVDGHCGSSGFESKYFRTYALSEKLTYGGRSQRCIHCSGSNIVEICLLSLPVSIDEKKSLSLSGNTTTTSKTSRTSLSTSLMRLISPRPKGRSTTTLKSTSRPSSTTKLSPKKKV